MEPPIADYFEFMPRRLLLLLTVALAGCDATNRGTADDPTPPGPQWLVNATDQCGLEFSQDPGPEGSYFMPQSMGTGAAMFDFDADGDLDLYLIQGAGPESGKPNQLFEQVSAGKFENRSKGSGVDVADFCTGVAVGDVDNDGYPDLLLTKYGGIGLFRNHGDGSFADVGTAARLHSLDWGTSAAFVDYDRDGWLDLFVANYVRYDPSRICFATSGQRDFCPPDSFPNVSARLYRNTTAENDGAVRFHDVTKTAGITKQGPGLGVVCMDFNGDRWQDIFVANDMKPNHLWINQCDGTFADEAISRGVSVTGMGQAAADMGIAVGDVDGDGLFDLFVTHLGLETHTLWKQGPRGLFRDATADANLAWVRTTGFGTAMADFDQDGDLDLAMVNGRISIGATDTADHLGQFWSRYAEKNLLFENNGKGRFSSIARANPDFCGLANVGRGLCCGDIDGDGGQDLLATPILEKAVFLRNVVPRRGNWMIVAARNPRLKRDAYGAEITVHAGKRQWKRWINPGLGYLTSFDPRAHFGFGEISTIDRIDVIWPDGDEEQFPGAAVNQEIVLEKGNGRTP